jgi:transposase
MTLHERSRLGAAAQAQRAAERAETLRRLMKDGEAFKRAAHKVGVSVRTARRYRQRWR